MQLRNLNNTMTQTEKGESKKNTNILGAKMERRSFGDVREKRTSAPVVYIPLRTISIRLTLETTTVIVMRQVNVLLKRNTVHGTPAQIINRILEDTGPAVQGKMPNKDAIRKLCQRTRNFVAAVPPTPLDLLILIIPEAFRIYQFASGQTEIFLMKDTGSELPDPQIIFLKR
ncbi:unnamed protein product [Psylliodes chrysocephalus]|uniref:Uncharacterized protein n=1 Tax=Psylliodes chrysocephalus TaxID=3402493 RepID=A0A9P0CYK8_9CUCU|nr:unnamed protein product [Psylliodes chrysocephala]